MEIGSKTAEKNSAQTKKQTDRHYENNGHLAVNQQTFCLRSAICMQYKDDAWSAIQSYCKCSIESGFKSLHPESRLKLLIINTSNQAFFMAV